MKSYKNTSIQFKEIIISLLKQRVYAVYTSYSEQVGQPALYFTQSYSWNFFETDIPWSVVEIGRAYSEHNVRTGKVLSLQEDSAQ